MSIIPFTYEGSQLRTVSIDGEPWFVAKDVCDILELSNPSMALARLDDDERSKFNLGRQGDVNIVNEPGLYSLILASRKPEAKPFKRWVTHEVIPSIRKHGAYMTPAVIEKTLTDPDFIISLATELKAEQARVRQLEAEQSIIRPKADSWDLWLSTNADYAVAQIAKALHKAGATTVELTERGTRTMGQNNLMQWLRENDWIANRDNTPLQRRINQSYMTIRVGGFVNPKTGEHVGTTTPRITAKGAARLAEIFQVMPETVMANLPAPEMNPGVAA